MSPSSTTVPLAILNERLTPALAVLAGLGLWFVMYVLAPVVPRWPQEFYPIGLFILCTFGLLAGLAIPEIMKVEFAPAVVDPEVFRSYFRLIFILATIELVAKAVGRVSHSGHVGIGLRGRARLDDANSGIRAALDRRRCAAAARPSNSLLDAFE